MNHNTLSVTNKSLELPTGIKQELAARSPNGIKHMEIYGHLHWLEMNERGC